MREIMSSLNTTSEVLMTDDDNVIMFPKPNPRAVLNDPIQTESDVDDHLAALHNNHIDRVLDAITQNLVEDLVMGGFNVQEECAPDVAFIIEGIRSLMNKKYGIFHPFHELAAKAMYLDEDEVFLIRDGIDIIVNDEENVDEEVVEEVKLIEHQTQAAADLEA